jgi:hypothetical protein
MDSGLIVRPNGSAVRAGASRRSGAVRSAIATDLATPQIVTAAPDVAVVRNDTGRTAPDESSGVAKIIRDAHSREVMYRALDERSRRVMHQAPESVAMRLKAYARSTKENANLSGPQADFEV